MGAHASRNRRRLNQNTHTLNKAFRPCFFVAYLWLCLMLKGAVWRYYGREKGDNMFIYYNPNPKGTRVGDCAVRAVALATGQDWQQAYIGIALQGYTDCNMPSANTVWGEYLRRHGFRRHPADEDTSVARFADEHRQGIYVLALADHVVTIKDGNVFDSWDSSRETVIYYWERTNDEQL